MKSTSSLVMPMLPNTSAITGISISTSLCSRPGARSGDWANEAIDTGRTGAVGGPALTGTP
jgi:hypothetical protein